MKYAAQLLGDEPILEKVALCFQGDSARIRKVDNQWFLESSLFESCLGPTDVFPVANEILLAIHRISVLYANFKPKEHVKIGYVQEFSDLGVKARKGLQTTQMVNIYRSAGLDELKELQGSQPRGSAVIERALSNEDVKEALSLIGEGEINWPQLYNILEFLGGESGIARRGWATKVEVRRYKQTANHYRHLGSPKKYPLPSDPPSLSDGIGFILLNILKKWISTQL